MKGKAINFDLSMRRDHLLICISVSLLYCIRLEYEFSECNVCLCVYVCVCVVHMHMCKYNKGIFVL